MRITRLTTRMTLWFSAVLACVGLAAGPVLANECAPGAVPPVVVDVTGVSSTVGDSVRAKVPAALAQVATRVPFTNCAPIAVRVVPDIVEGEGHTTWGLPEWAAGAAQPHKREIVLAVHRDGQRHDRDRTLIHELAHVAVYDAAHGHAPRWLDEGIARSTAEEGGEASLLALAKRRAGGGVFPLMALAERFPADTEAANLAYATSERAVSQLLAHHGQDGVQHILARLGEGESVEAALIGVTGEGVRDLEARVTASVPVTTAWATLFRQVDIWWLIPGGALLFAFARRRKRRPSDLGDLGRVVTWRGPLRRLKNGATARRVHGYSSAVEEWRPAPRPSWEWIDGFGWVPLREPSVQ